MSKKLKTGFSLVEVMILFAVLAVVMAASLPMLSKKSTVPPRKTPHGVYICVANGDAPRQELYNSTNLLGAHNDGEACVFNVPRANEYKVELYSAGAGGVQYATISSQWDAEQVYNFDRFSARQYYNGTTENQISSVLPYNMSYIPTNDEFRQVLSGIVLTLKTNTGHGGRGGDSTFHYTGVTNIFCNGHDHDEIPEMNVYKDAPATSKYNNEVAQQYKEYCIKQNNASAHKVDYSRPGITIVYTTDAGTLRRQWGGSGGSGVDMALDFRIVGAESANAFYSGFRYPFLAYFSDLVNNVAGHGYYAAKCDGASGINQFSINNCQAGSPQNGEDAGDVDSDSVAMKKEDPYYRLSAKSGKDVTEYAAFRVPPFSNNANNNVTGNPIYPNSPANRFVTVQNTMAKGGEGGETGYRYKTEEGDEIKYTPGSNDTSNDYSYTVFRGHVPSDDSVSVKPSGDNATMLENNASDKSRNSDSGWTYYRIYSGADVPDYNVWARARLISHLMRRNYRVGNPGSNGLHKTYRVTTLGERCTMVVPNGGPVMQFANYNNAQWQADAERALEVSIECRDTEDHVVFQQSLNGARYDTTLTSSTYNWQRSGNANNAGRNNLEGLSHTANAPDPVNMNYIRPRWSRVFNNINTLNNFHIGQGGRGTSITDRCNVPNGTFSMAGYQYNNVDDDVLVNQLPDINHDGTMANGYQCYPALGTTRTYDNIKSDPLATPHYTITEPTAGGPAAIIITW